MMMVEEEEQEERHFFRSARKIQTQILSIINYDFLLKLFFFFIHIIKYIIKYVRLIYIIQINHIETKHLQYNNRGKYSYTRGE